MLGLLVLMGAALFVLVLLSAGVFTVKQQSVALIERFGKFQRIAGPGLHALIPFVEVIRSHVYLRIRQLDVQVETKTQDNVFINITVAVQYQVLESKI